MRKHLMVQRLAALIAISLISVMQGQAQQGQLPGPTPTLVKVKNDLYVIENVHANLDEIMTLGGNVVIYRTDEGVILVDSKNEKLHDDIVAKVKSLTDKPIKYVILSHNHGDHAGGAAKMAAMGATVIISTSDRENMAREPNQKWLPQFSYEGRANVLLGGKEAQLYEVRGHTKGDTIVYFPAERVVCGGDLFATSPELPFIVSYADGGNWMDLGNALDELLKLDFELLIPGHGPVVTKPQVVAIRNKVVAIRERFRGLVREKKTPEEITKVLMKEFNWGVGPASWNIPGMMEELH